MTDAKLKPKPNPNAKRGSFRTILAAVLAVIRVVTEHKVEGGPKQRSLQSILLWTSGILAAVATILINATKIQTWIQVEFPQDPYAVEISKPTVVPSYLHYFYAAEGLGAQESLYWFHEKVQNKTRQSLNLEIFFTLQPSDCHYVSLESEGPIEDSFGAHEKKEVKVSPSLKFNNDNFEGDCFLKIQWTIQDPQKNKIYRRTGNAEIKLLAPNIVKWDLVNSENKQVSREFLLASLTSWSLSREGIVLNRAGQLKKMHANVSTPEEWVSLCYEDLFGGRSALAIDASRSTFPFVGQTSISSPGQILSKGRAEPLEASFLMAAMIHAAPMTERARLTLFIVPHPENPRDPSVLLSWLLPDRRTWEAVDLREARELAYKANLDQSQPRLKLLLEEHPEILRSLRARGVFLGPEPNAVMAISFDRAVKQFGIRALN
jgi:hypothetical protein